MSLLGDKVISAKAMAEVERLSTQQGASSESYMQKAGEGIAELVAQFIQIHHLPKQVTLLVGKGNNGGDAFVVGILLMQQGFEVEALHLYQPEECSPLCQKHREIFSSMSGKFTQEIPLSGVVVDGLLGTGFEGELSEPLKEVIEKANQSSLPLIAIDIPSGLSGNTGKVESVAVQATMTVYLGQPKKGFFLNQGFDHVGKLERVDFGLSQKYVDALEAEAYLINEHAIPKYMPKMKRTQHKYQAGYVLGAGGSSGMAGAAIMSSWAALKAGAGIVRLFHEKGIEEELINGPLELVKEAIEYPDVKPILKECNRAKACFIGPGLGRSEKAIEFVRALLSQIEIPCVCDADALYAISQLPNIPKKPNWIYTPHRGEMLKLLHRSEAFADDQDLINACKEFAESHSVILVLKGAPTFIFQPQSQPVIMHRGDPGMATAGAGDVLTGIIAALLAAGLVPFHAAVIGAHLHALAGEMAALDESSYSVMATDLIDYLSDAITSVFI